MAALARWVARARWWVLAAWVALAVVGGFAAPHATSALSYDFGLPGRPGSAADARIAALFGGTGGENAPVLVVVGDAGTPATAAAGTAVTRAVLSALPGARVAGYPDHPELVRDGVGVVLVYPKPLPDAPEPYAQALPVLDGVSSKLQASLQVPVRVTGQDALNDSGGGGGGPDVLLETIFGGVGALVVLVAVFGSFLALTPLVVAAASILTTFLVLWGLTAVTDVSFIVQYLLALIGLGVAIDYALLIVTRWREERGHGLSNEDAVARAVTVAGRSVLFSGVTVAVSLAALIFLPVPFLRSVGFTGLLIPLFSLVAALTLLPALLLVAGPRLDWPHRRRTAPDSRLWHRVGTAVVRHRWASVVLSAVVLLALAAPVLGLRLGSPTNDALASGGGPAAVAIHDLEDAGLGAGLTQPSEILATSPDRVAAALRAAGAHVVAPSTWRSGESSVVEAWTSADASSSAGSSSSARIRSVATGLGAQVGGLPAGTADFVDAVYGNAWWVVLVIAVVTFLLLARALRSVVLPLKALLLNVLSLGAAYGVTVVIWQDGAGTRLLFDQDPSGAITTWVPIAVFAFLFGLSMDYEVFLLSRMREEHDNGASTDEATVRGIARTGRLVSSAAVILFLAFVSLSRVPSVDVKILATGLALGIIIDATVVRGVLAPALVAALGRWNWVGWRPRVDA